MENLLRALKRVTWNVLLSAREVSKFTLFTFLDVFEKEVIVPKKRDRKIERDREIVRKLFGDSLSPSPSISKRE